MEVPFKMATVNKAYYNERVLKYPSILLPLSHPGRDKTQHCLLNFH